MKNEKNRWLILVGLILLAAILVGKLLLDRQHKLQIDHLTVGTNQSLELPTEETEPSVEIELESEPVTSMPVEKQTPILEDLPTTIILADKNYHLFFDLRHILLHSSGTTAAKELGVSNMFWYTVKHKHTPNHLEIQARLFEFMDYCTQQPRGTALFNNEPMPAIMCQWISGQLSTQQFLDSLLSYRKEIKEFFSSQEEQNLVLGTLELLKPDIICKIQRPINKMVAFFQECCNQFPGQIYILSNWDRESANLIRCQFKQIFGHLDQDHIIFSGETGKLKPELDCFKSITESKKLDPKRCVLIDDSPENIRIAKSLGWHTILHKNTDRTMHKIKKLLSIKTNVIKTKKKKKNKYGA